MVKYISQKEIARRFRIKPQLVRDLVYESKNNPDKLEKAKHRTNEISPIYYILFIHNKFKIKLSYIITPANI